MAAQLIKTGWQVSVIKPSWVTKSSKKSFAKAVNVIALEALDETKLAQLITQQGQLDAVIYMHGSEQINDIAYPDTSKQGLMLAFLLAKLTNVKAAQIARPSFMVVTRQGGRLGFANDTIAADINADLVQSGLTGLVKTVSHEWPSVFCRAVDVSQKLGTDKVATIVTDELLDVDTELSEVAYDFDNKGQGGRLTLVGETTDSYSLTSGNSITADSVFLVSGGAKGVTAHCVIEIAKQYQAKFILLGRSEFDANEPSWAQGITEQTALKKAAMQALIAAGDKPTPVKVTQFIKPVLANREIAATLDAIAAAGGQAVYVSADVTNSESVKAAVEPVVSLLGDGTLEINGIIHGAGVLADKFIEQKTLAEFDSVYRTKIDGLTSLLSVTAAKNIKHLVLFSSAAGFYGNPGQSDYAIANEILNKTAYRFKALNPSAQVLSFNWGPWDGGMVTPELKRMFNDRGVYIIPLDAGAKLLVSELAAQDNRCAQILVGNDLSKQQETVAGTDVKKPQVSRLTKAIETTNNAFLADHMINGDKVLPTVCAQAWMSETAVSLFPDFKLHSITDYSLFKGIVFDGTEPNEVQLDHKVLVQTSEQVQLEVKVSSQTSQGKTVFHYAAVVNLVKQSSNNDERVSIELPQLAKADRQDHALYQDGTLFHGETFQGINQVFSCDEQGLLLACGVSQTAVQKQGGFVIPVAHSAQHNIFANDLVYQAMLVWVRKQLGMGSLPAKTQMWQVQRQVMLNEQFYISLNVVSHTSTKLIANLQIIATDKTVLATIEGAEVTISESLNDLFLPVKQGS